MCGGMVLITITDTLIRHFAASYPLPELMFMRGMASLPALAAAAAFLAGTGGLRLRWRLHYVVRGALMSGTHLCFFVALVSLPYSTAIGIFFICPVLLTLMCALLLRERVGPWRWGAVLAGLLGVALMARPETGSWNWLKLLPLCAAAMYAGVQVLNRATRHVSDAVTMAVSAHAGIFVTSICMGLLLGDGRFLADPTSVSRLLLGAWIVPANGDIAAMAACGIVSAVAAILMFQSYRLAEGSLVAPFEYIALPLAALSGYLFWSEIPDQQSVAGIALIAGAGLLVSFRERNRNRRANEFGVKAVPSRRFPGAFRRSRRRRNGPADR